MNAKLSRDSKVIEWLRCIGILILIPSLYLIISYYSHDEIVIPGQWKEPQFGYTKVFIDKKADSSRPFFLEPGDKINIVVSAHEARVEILQKDLIFTSLDGSVPVSYSPILTGVGIKATPNTTPKLIFSFEIPKSTNSENGDLIITTYYSRTRFTYPGESGHTIDFRGRTVEERIVGIDKIEKGTENVVFPVFSKEFIDQFIILNKGNIRQRKEAVKRLSEMGDNRAIDILIDVLKKDGNPRVRKAALMVLGQMTGENFGPKPTKWQEWWEKNKDKFEKGK